MNVLPHPNGATEKPSQAWLKQTVQQFFNGINWDNHPPEIQQLRSVQGDAQLLSLLLTVNQFFSAVNWDDSSVASPLPLPAPAADAEADTFTLEDLSDLF